MRWYASTLALVLALLVGLLPAVWALGRLLPGRLAWAREAAAADRLRADVDLLALRAAASAPLPALAALGPDPVTRWRAGDDDAALELRRLGLRPESQGRALPAGQSASGVRSP